MQIKTIAIFFLTIFISSYAQLPRKAMCTTSVLDVVEYPLGGSDSPWQEVDHAYKNIPISWGPNEQDRQVCPRSHQLLLHDIVTIIDETPCEAFIQLDACFVTDLENQKQSLTGWVLKNHLKNLDELDSKKTPAFISWTNPNVDRANVKTVTLFTSFGDSTGTIYCAGTRFILNKLINMNFEVFAYSEAESNYRSIEIPQSSCVFETFYYTPEEKRNNFCKLLTIWTSIPSNCIPLVWGGASVGTVCNPDNFDLQALVNEEGQIRYAWTRPSKTVGDVYTGVDASSAILRAAQIMGIPYYCRNSKTAMQTLTQLAITDYPKSGDILWLPGSLLVINDLNKNTIITTMSYASGYGALVELPLSKVFKDISTYHQLSQAYRKGLSLTILNRDGSSARTVDEFKILRMF